MPAATTESVIRLLRSAYEGFPGRVVAGIELISSLPRGGGELGFYEQPEERAPIQSIRVAAELPPAERKPLEVMSTDTPIFQKLVELRRNR